MARDIILQHQEDRRADQRAPEAAHAAEHRHDDEIARLIPAYRARIDEIAQQRVETPGDADKKAGNHPRHPDMLVDRNAEEAGATLVLAYRQQRAAERRAQQERHEGDRGGKYRQHEVVERLFAVEDIEGGKAEMDRLALPGAQAVVTAGDRAPLERDVIEHPTEGGRA